MELLYLLSLIGTYSNTLSTDDFNTNSIKMYPNPSSLGYVTIKSRTSEALDISVYSLLGKQVISETITDERLNVSRLNAGLYIMRISQNDATITKKLVIK